MSELFIFTLLDRPLIKRLRPNLLISLQYSTVQDVNTEAQYKVHKNPNLLILLQDSTIHDVYNEVQYKVNNKPQPADLSPGQYGTRCL